MPGAGPRLAEALAAEALAAEAELVHRPDLHGRLGLPRPVRRALLQAYRQGVGAGDVPQFTLAASTGPVGYGSSSPIVTSDGTTSGSALVWMVVRLNAGDELRAYDAVPVNGQLHLRAAFPVGRFATSVTGVPGVALPVNSRILTNRLRES